MKKLFSTILVALVATVASYAQTIAVVSSSGSTTMYQDFGKAVNEAKDGSTIYLPGGGFQLNDTIRIKHKVTIMGVSHRADTDNAEGATTISGNIWFNEGSDGSAVMGCYVTGSIVVGEDKAVNNILVRYCNVRFIDIRNRECNGNIVNQCYVRGQISASGAPVIVTNNIVHRITSIDGGTILNNIITIRHNQNSGTGTAIYINNSTFRHNILESSYYPSYMHFDDCIVTDNICFIEIGEGNIVPENFDDMFVNSEPGINIAANWHFTEDYKKYSEYGIYGGSGFDDQALAPIPRIISKEIPEQTDASGKLNIKITVKAK